MSRGRRKSNDDGMGCLVYAILGLFLMPIVGLFLAFSKDPEKKMWGWILLAVGSILWIIIAVGSG